jgi:RHS repeat-associated protein
MNPGGGADWITNYTYDALGHLVGVSMPRDNGTQTRTFVYTGNDMTSATNPENGTVTYQYDGSHRVTKRTGAKQQETRYTYDWYGRLLEVQHWAWVWHYVDPTYTYRSFEELPMQRVDYSYDTNPLNGSYSQNAWGRLTAVQFQDENRGDPYTYMYSYNAAGRVTVQHASYSGNYNNYSVSFDAAYTWDTEGRMTGINYGSLQYPQQQYPQQYTMQYDANGRLGGMQDATNGNATVGAASYGAAGEMLGLTYFGYGETRTYNAMLQLTRMQGPWMDMQYVYPAGGANNGRIAQTIDGVGGETVNYTYDALNRLATAGATNGSWGQAYSYDGFGNLVGKSVTQGSAPVLSVSVDPATNRVVGQMYDANGNLNGNAGGIADVENRIIYGRGTYVYDPFGKRVASGGAEFYFYGVGGQKLATVVCTGNHDCAAPQYNVYFGGKLVKSKGVLVVTDRLGSVRANSGERMSYYPYGEEKTSTADDREKFGTYTRDSVVQDYADQRYYAVGMGRFGTPDPSTGVRLGVPATWNKYTYVHGDPINFYDPRGLNEADPDGYCPAEYESCDYPGGGDGDGGGGGGGGSSFVEPHGPEGTGPWMTVGQRNWNVALLEALAAMAVHDVATSTPSYDYVAYLKVTSDCITMDNPKTGAPSRDRTYQAYDGSGQPIGATITERVLDMSGGLSTVTGNGGSSTTGVYNDQMGLNVFQSGTATLYQYFVTTIAGTPWVGVPTQIVSQDGSQKNMVLSVTVSRVNGVNNVSYNGDAGMWNGDGSPRLPICGQ